MKKQISLITISIITIILTAFLIIIKFNRGINLYSKNGEIDFYYNDFDNSYYLNGEWEAYPNILLASNNLNFEEYQADLYKIPNNNNIFSESNEISFRILLNNIPKHLSLTLDIDDNISNYAIYFNRNLIKSKNYYINKEKIITHQNYYLTDGNDIEIIIETSNHNLTTRPQIFSYQNYLKTENISKHFYYITLGFLLFAAVFQFYNFIFQEKKQKSFYFALILLSSCFFILFNPSNSNINYKINFYLFHISYYLVTILLYLFVRKCYKKQKYDLFDSFFLFITLVILLLLIILPFNILNNFIIFINLLNIFSIFFIWLYSILNIKKELWHPFIALIIGLILIANIFDLILIEGKILSIRNISSIISITIALIYTAIVVQLNSDKVASADELVILNEKIRDTEFTFLNSQIQSHFIYNTLNSIQSLCITDPLKSADLIEDFSSYLRTRLEFNKMPILIEFADELDNIKTYLNIEKVRFGDRVNFSYNIRVGEFKIPPLTVQPLVENAIKHGLSKKRKGGSLIISTYEDEKNIYIKVEDDGLGFDPNTLEEKQRVGTKNITDRLSLHLHAILKISSAPYKGTIAIIKIPKQKKM